MKVEKVAMYMRLSNYEEDIGKQKKIVAYVRVANKSEMGASNQVEYIKHYAESKGISIDDIYIDDGYSGANNDRPEFKRLLNDVGEGLIDTIYVKNFSRISRDLSSALYYVNKYFPSQNVKIYSIDEDKSKIETPVNSTHFKEEMSKKIRAGIYAKKSKKEYVK